MSSATHNTETASDQEGIEIDYEELSRLNPEQFYSGTIFQQSWGNHEDEDMMPLCFRFIAEVVREVINESRAPDLEPSFSLDDIEQGRAEYLRPLFEVTRTSIELSVEQTTCEYDDVSGSLEEIFSNISGVNAESSDSQLTTEFPQIEPVPIQETAFPVATDLNAPESRCAEISPRILGIATRNWPSTVVRKTPLDVRWKLPKLKNAHGNIMGSKWVLDAAELPPCSLEMAIKNRPFTTFKQPDLARELPNQVNSTTRNAGPRKVPIRVLDEADLPPCSLGIGFKKQPCTYLHNSSNK